MFSERSDSFFQYEDLMFVIFLNTTFGPDPSLKSVQELALLCESLVNSYNHPDVGDNMHMANFQLALDLKKAIEEASQKRITTEEDAAQVIPESESDGSTSIKFSMSEVAYSVRGDNSQDNAVRNNQTKFEIEDGGEAVRKASKSVNNRE